MFISKEDLNINLGLDKEIATHFVDRNVPLHNLYWKGKYLYISKGNGYLFIPVLVDLMFKCGVPKNWLLEENFLQTMEQVLDSAARYEHHIFSFHQHIETCKQILVGKINNQVLYADLCAYFNQELKPYKYLGTFSRALNRGDSFLFSFVVLPLGENILQCIIEEWYSLIPSFLLMDDIIDLHEDKKKNDENSLHDFGIGRPGIENAIEFLYKKFDNLKKINSNLGVYFERSLELKIKTPYMQSILNS